VVIIIIIIMYSIIVIVVTVGHTHNKVLQSSRTFLQR